MNTIQKTVCLKLAKAWTKKELKGKLNPGEYKFKFSISIEGSLKKGEDYLQTVPASVDPWGLLAVALSKLNDCTLESIVRDFIAFDEDQGKLVKEQALEAIQELKDGTEKVFAGKLSSVKIHIKELDNKTLLDKVMEIGR